MNAATLQTLHPRAGIIAFEALPLSSQRVEPTARYGERRRPNWLAIALIAVLHGIGFVALVKLDVIRAVPRLPEPLVMTLVPEAAPPPPTAPAPRVEAVAAPVVAAVAVPVPTVKTPAPAPPIATTSIVAPAAAAPLASAPPAATAVSSPVAAPITPPSASAATLDNPAPRYPMDARRKRQEGTVRLRVVITVSGRVKDISVARSSGFDSLDEAALAAVRRWTFVPGMQAGQPVEAIGFVPIPFRLTA